MGHTGLVKFDRNYFKTQVLELAEEYLNAVSNLTISDEERTKAENRQLRKEKSERAKTELDILYLKDEVARLRQSMEHTKKQKSKS